MDAIVTFSFTPARMASGGCGNNGRNPRKLQVANTKQQAPSSQLCELFGNPDRRAGWHWVEARNQIRVRQMDAAARSRFADAKIRLLKNNFRQAIEHDFMFS